MMKVNSKNFDDQFSAVLENKGGKNVITGLTKCKSETDTKFR